MEEREIIVLASVAVLCLAFLGGFVVGIRAATPRLQAHSAIAINRLSRLVQQIADHLDVPLPDDDRDEELRDLMRVKQKIQAVRRCRELYPGVGLAEAKAYVERLEL